MEKYTVPAENLIELHLHLDGSISAASARELAKLAGKTLPEDDAALLRLLRVEEGCRDLNEYLDRFLLPLSLLQTAQGVELAAFRLCRELQQEGHIYAELRFAPQSSCMEGLTQEQAVQAAIAGVRRSGFPGQLILCCMRSGADNSAANLETVELAAEYLGKGVCACDLAGAEALFPNDGYGYIFQRASELGVPYTIHAGEALGPESVRLAVEFGAKRIGHGVRGAEDPAVLALLKEKGVTLEVCPTSNLQTCVFTGYRDVPADLFRESGIPIAVSSDNRAVSGTDVRRELQHLADAFGYGRDEVRQLLLNAADASFADPETKALLRAKILRE